MLQPRTYISRSRLRRFFSNDPTRRCFLLQRSHKKICLHLVSFLVTVSPIQQQQSNTTEWTLTMQTSSTGMRACVLRTIIAWWLEGARSYQIKVPGHVSADHRGSKRGDVSLASRSMLLRARSWNMGCICNSACDDGPTYLLPDACFKSKPSLHSYAWRVSE